MKLYIVDGDPIPLKRPRLSTGVVFDSQKKQKLITGISLSNQHNDQPLFDGPLSVDIVFYMKTPIKKYKDLIGKYHTNRTDLDNLVKYILDAANTILYADDALIAEINAKKVYDARPRTEFFIKKL